MFLRIVASNFHKVLTLNLYRLTRSSIVRVRAGHVNRRSTVHGRVH